LKTKSRKNTENHKILYISCNYFHNTKKAAPSIENGFSFQKKLPFYDTVCRILPHFANRLSTNPRQLRLYNNKVHWQSLEVVSKPHLPAQ
jgi:hypothetical protein